jgi:hypothetical protein
MEATTAGNAIFVNMRKRTSAFAVLFLFALIAHGTSDPYAALTPEQRKILQPAIERWIHDQIKHDWADLWEIQDQTGDLKNELVSGQRTAPDLIKTQFVEAMKETIGIGYPEIKAFRLLDVKTEGDGFSVIGCGREQREEWHQVRITFVHVRIVDGKPKFDLHGGNSDTCEM